MKEQNNIKMTWWERNKKKVLIIGGVVVAVGIGVVVFKNKDALVALLKKSNTITNKVPKISEVKIVETTADIVTVAKTESITTNKVINDGLPFGVDGFVRNLPEGWHPSAEKIAQAAKMGIELGSHQTYVNPYMKNVA